MRLRVSPFVEHDLAEIADSIAKDSPRHAADWIRTLRSRFRDIAKQPRAYRLRPEIGIDARIAPVGRYIVLFRIHKGVVRIERVLHGNRDLPPRFEEVQQ